MNYNKIIYGGISSNAVSRLNFASLPRRKFLTACTYVGHLLQEQPASIEQILYGADGKGIRFFKNLARKFNLRNAELPKSKWESKEDLIQIFDLIKDITPVHFDILRKTQEGFDSLKKIFSLAQDNKTLDFVSKLQSDVLGAEQKQSNIIIGLLNSKNKPLFMQKAEQFKSYFKLNEKNPNALTELEHKIDKNCFDGKKYDAELAVKNLMQFKIVRDCANKIETDLIKYYTKAGERLLWRLSNKLQNDKAKLINMDKKDFVNIYKTTTPDNIELRLGVLDKFCDFSVNRCYRELKELKKLFKTIEQNKEAKEFVLNSTKRGLGVNSAEEMNTVVESVNLKKANYFFDNVKRIVALSEGDIRKDALLNELENPFFVPGQKRTTKILHKEGNISDYGFIGRINVYLKNKVKVFIYNNIKSHTEVPVVTEKASTPKIKVNNLVPAQKIQLIKDVNDIIKAKLGKRTYNEQEDTYRLKATKIRLNLLPEIFDSIKAVRAQNRVQGIELKVSNKDASRLYELINGTNKKTVRYMLKKCDENGNRIFDVKQIIGLIENSNKDIREAKAINPNYRAADTRAYYENTYNDFVSRYGKLKRASKQKPNAA